VDLVDGAAVERLGGNPGRFEVRTSAGSTYAATVVDADETLALSVAAGLGEVAVTTSHHVIRTVALPPLLSVGLQIDGVDVRQLADGTVELSIPSPGPWASSGLAAVASAVRTVVGVVPAFAAAGIVDHRVHREALAADGLPIVGPVVEGLWATGGWGRHGLDAVAVMSDALAEAVVDGATEQLPAPFQPRRLVGSPRPAAGAPGPLTCSACGVRRSEEFRLAGRHWWHAAGCGRLAGIDEVVIDLRDGAGDSTTVHPVGAGRGATMPAPATSREPVPVPSAGAVVVGGEVPA
jgi:hypothetical protein